MPYLTFLDTKENHACPSYCHIAMKLSDAITDANIPSMKTKRAAANVRDQTYVHKDERVGRVPKYFYPYPMPTCWESPSSWRKPVDLPALTKRQAKSCSARKDAYWEDDFVRETFCVNLA